MTKGALNVGAGTGISASFARLLAKEGYKIVLASRDPGKFERLARETGATCCAADASDPASVDAEGRTVRMFTYPTIESARRAATAWTVAYGDCLVKDKTGMKE